MASPSVKVVIGNLQFWMMAIMSITGFGHFVYLHVAQVLAGRDTWIALLCSSVPALLFLLLYRAVVGADPTKSLVEHAKQDLGPWIGFVFGVVYVLFFALAGVLTVNTFALFWGVVFPLTPPSLFPLLILLTAAWMVYAGIEVLARFIQIMLPGLMMIGVAVSLLLMKDRHFSLLLPLLYHGWLPIWQGTWIFGLMFAESLVLLMLIPYVREPQKLTGQGLWVVLLLIVMFLGPATGSVSIFGQTLGQSLTYPTFAEVQYIQYPDVLERLDVFGLLLWATGSLSRTSLYLFGVVEGIAQLTGAAQKNRYTLPATSLCLGISLVTLTHREDTYSFLSLGYTVIIAGVAIVLPLLTVCVKLVRLGFKKPPPPAETKTATAKRKVASPS